MPISYDPSSPRGVQWTVTDDDGRRHTDLPANVVRGILKQRGMTVREIEAHMASARLQATA